MKKRENEKDPLDKKSFEAVPEGKSKSRGMEILEEAGYRLVKGWLTPDQEDKN
jgi:hypothetical protein